MEVEQGHSELPTPRKSQKQKEGENIRAFLIGGLFLTLPYIFLIRVVQGEDFFLAYLWYWSVALKIGSVLGIIVGILVAIRYWWPCVFENTPKIKDEWFGPIAAGVALVGAIVVGVNYGGQTGMLVFWPFVFVGFCVVYAAVWTFFQIQRLWHWYWS